MNWERCGIYWLPGGALGAAGAGWLGWDARRGRTLRSERADTRTPRRYGFHMTLKPPFRLREGKGETELAAAARSLAAAWPPAPLGRLAVRRLGRFLALAPEDPAPVSRLAAALVEGLDAFRAPPPPEETARRRATGLSPAQDALLKRWGYPYVMDEFRPHLTLTGADPGADAADEAGRIFGPLLARPVTVRAVALVGEDGLGRFSLIEEIPLQGAASSAARAAEAAS